MALGLAGASEGAHMNHPDFRAGGRIFATLHGDGRFGMVKLPPDEQQRFMRSGAAFSPEAGAWGRQGCTRVELARVDEEILGEALTVAWQHASAAPRRSRAAGARRPKPSAPSRSSKSARRGRRS